MEDHIAKIEELRVPLIQKHTKNLVQKLDEEKKARLEAEKSQQEFQEKYSKLALNNPPEFPLDTFYKAVLQRKFISLKYIPDLVRSDIEQQQDWFTISVLAIKSEIKVSKTGSNYQIFTLADLEGAEFIVFIFGDAFQELCKMVCGSVVAVLNALPLPAKDGRQAYKIEKPSQVLKLGTAAHYSRCSGIDGIHRCEGWVNV